jgi:hypothetical protein
MVQEKLPYTDSKNNGWLYKTEKLPRYVLGKTGDKPIICIGINPSTATPENLDPTIKRVEQIIKNNGYDSWIMLNIYPEIASDITELPKTQNANYHDKNLKVVKNIISKIRNLAVWCMWGGNIERRDYLYDCLYEIHDLFRKKQTKWFSIGQVKNGHPKHPLYNSVKSKLKPFNMDEYIKRG